MSRLERYHFKAQGVRRCTRTQQYAAVFHAYTLGQKMVCAPATTQMHWGYIRDKNRPKMVRERQLYARITWVRTAAYTLGQKSVDSPATT